jgi:N-acetylmuramoyl-L-alanine amidase-like protein
MHAQTSPSRREAELRARRRTASLLVLAALVGTGALAGSASSWGIPDSFGATTSAATKPQIHKMLIPFPKKRKREMADYSKDHYGQHTWRLTDPKQIVIHYAEAGSISSIYSTFAPDRPDVEFHQLPGVCAHYAVSASGGVYKFVPPTIRCRHVVGLNHVAIGVEHVGFSDQDILNRPAQLNGSLQFVQWLRCRFNISVDNVIGHNESLSSPFYKELDPRFRGQTHQDWNHADMETYRSDLSKLGSC